MGHIHMGAWHWTRTVTCTARRLAAAILAPSAAPTTAVSSTRSRHNVPVLIAAHIARNPEKESWADCLCNGDVTTVETLVRFGERSADHCVSTGTPASSLVTAVWSGRCAGWLLATSARRFPRMTRLLWVSCQRS